jgi:hypothetical protein
MRGSPNLLGVGLSASSKMHHPRMRAVTVHSKAPHREISPSPRESYAALSNKKVWKHFHLTCWWNSVGSRMGCCKGRRRFLSVVYSTSITCSFFVCTENTISAFNASDRDSLGPVQGYGAWNLNKKCVHPGIYHTCSIFVCRAHFLSMIIVSKEIILTILTRN